MIELTEMEKRLNIRAKLLETDEAIGYLAAANVPIPPEAIDIRTIMRRAVAAEEQLARRTAIVF